MVGECLTTCVERKMGSNADEITSHMNRMFTLQSQRMGNIEQTAEMLKAVENNIHDQQQNKVNDTTQLEINLKDIQIVGGGQEPRGEGTGEGERRRNHDDIVMGAETHYPSGGTTTPRGTPSSTIWHNTLPQNIKGQCLEPVAPRKWREIAKLRILDGRINEVYWSLARMIEKQDIAWAKARTVFLPKSSSTGIEAHRPAMPSEPFQGWLSRAIFQQYEGGLQP